MPVSRQNFDMPPIHRLPAALLLLLAGGSVVGCAAQQLETSRVETGEILGGLASDVAAQRSAARERTATEVEVVADVVDVPELVDLAAALQLAARHNRDLLRDREGLVLSALALRNARNDVGPRLSGSLAWLASGGEGAEERRTSSGTLGLTGLLPTGAEATASVDASQTHESGGLDGAGGGLELRVRQPLLRGFGRESAYEQLTDAQRQALYDVRTFELSREDLALRVQQAYYDLIAQRRVIGNRERSLEQFEYLKRRSERLFEVGRVSEVDTFRATREYLTAENALVDARQRYASQLDRFKILLGLPTDVDFEVGEDIPEPRPLAYDGEEALQLALANRLELMTARDQLEDAERRLRIRRQEVLPQLDVEAVYDRRDDSVDTRVGDLGFGEDRYSVGLSLELPLDRVRERSSLRRARIELSRSRRALSLTEDQVLLDVRDALRDLRSADSSLRIQREIVVSEERNVKIARLRFSNGEIGNRDLTDALTNLADAQDRLVREQVNVETARFQLLSALGLLVVGEDGTWLE